MAHPRISIDPAAVVGKPCIKGTRITVELVLRWLAGGRSVEDVIEAYPHITEGDVRAVLDYSGNGNRREAFQA